MGVDVILLPSSHFADNETAQGHSVRVGRADPDPGLLAFGTACFPPPWETEKRGTVMDKPRHIQSSARVGQVHTELTRAGVKDRA